MTPQYIPPECEGCHAEAMERLQLQSEGLAAAVDNILADVGASAEERNQTLAKIGKKITRAATTRLTGNGALLQGIVNNLIAGAFGAVTEDKVQLNAVDPGRRMTGRNDASGAGPEGTAGAMNPPTPDALPDGGTMPGQALSGPAPMASPGANDGPAAFHLQGRQAESGPRASQGLAGHAEESRIGGLVAGNIADSRPPQITRPPMPGIAPAAPPGLSGIESLSDREPSFVPASPAVSGPILAAAPAGPVVPGIAAPPGPAPAVPIVAGVDEVAGPGGMVAAGPFQPFSSLAPPVSLDASSEAPADAGKGGPLPTWESEPGTPGEPKGADGGTEPGGRGGCCPVDWQQANALMLSGSANAWLDRLARFNGVPDLFRYPSVNAMTQARERRMAADGERIRAGAGPVLQAAIDKDSM